MTDYREWHSQELRKYAEPPELASAVIEKVYEKARQLGSDDAETSAFLFQQEALLIHNLLTSARANTHTVWNENYPYRELKRIANAFGASLRVTNNVI